jgi:uncharacterized protein YcfJ
MKKSIRGWILLVPVAVFAAACGGDEPRAAMNDAMSRDLQLAASQAPYGQPYASPQELGYAQPYAPQYQQPQGYYATPVQTVYRAPAPAPVAAPEPRVVYRTRTVPAPEPVRHTKRDAVIGAAAGAVAGAAIGRDTKGALIGAAAGGLLGAVVGHTVDVKKP